MSEPKRYSYEGPAYVRPVSRGVLIGDDPAGGVYLDDVIEDLNGGDGDCRVRIEVTVWPGGKDR